MGECGCTRQAPSLSPPLAPELRTPSRAWGKETVPFAQAGSTQGQHPYLDICPLPCPDPTARPQGLCLPGRLPVTGPQSLSLKWVRHTLKAGFRMRLEWEAQTCPAFNREVGHRTVCFLLLSLPQEDPQPQAHFLWPEVPSYLVCRFSRRSYSRQVPDSPAAPSSHLELGTVR